MKAIPQTPGPNGSGVVKRRSLPRLGDGLCEVLDDVSRLCTTGEEPANLTTAATTIRTSDSSSSACTISGTPPETNVTTPVSCVGSSNISQSHTSKNQAGDSSFDGNGHRVSILRPQHYGPSPLTSTQTQPLLSSAASTSEGHNNRLSSISPVTSFSTYPIHTIPTHIPSTRRILQEPTPSSDLALNKIILWFLDGTLSLSEAKETAKKYKYWDFLNLLEGSHAATRPGAPQHNVSQVRGSITPVSSKRSTGHSTPHLYNDLNSRTIPGGLHVTEDVHHHFHWKMMKHVDIDKLVDPCGESKLHLFVDISNIFIGFCDAIKASRRIPQSQRIPAPAFSFKAFAVLMERGRNVQKRILAGSTPGYSASNHREHWPAYFLEAENLRYDMNIFCRVQTRKPNHPKRKGRKSPKASHDVHDLSTGESTGDDILAMTYEVRKGEQGVDENLHLNMMNSMWDHISCPGTMVLATGDAAEAEFSNGFLHYATRALEKGWRLELVTWKHSISSAWTNERFSGKYSSQFRIIYLDGFLEELQANTGGFSV